MMLWQGKKRWQEQDARRRTRSALTKKRKRKARTVVGMPPPARVVPEKRDKPEKHRKRRDESEGL